MFAPLVKECKEKNIKIVTNAGASFTLPTKLLESLYLGGMNPLSLKLLLEEISAKQGVSLKIAAITGDDIFSTFPSLKKNGSVLSFSVEGEEESLPFNRPLMSSNAYIGSFPIAAALAEGADVVVTGLRFYIAFFSL